MQAKYLLVTIANNYRSGGCCDDIFYGSRILFIIYVYKWIISFFFQFFETM